MLLANTSDQEISAMYRTMSQVNEGHIDNEMRTKNYNNILLMVSTFR